MKTNTKTTLSIYFSETRRLWIHALIVIFGVIGASGVRVLIPLYFKDFFDILGQNTPTSLIATQLITILGSIAILELTSWVLWRTTLFTAIRLQSTVLTSLNNRCFSYLHGHSFSFFNNNFVGSLVKRVNWFTKAYEGISDRAIFDFLPLITDLTIILVVLLQKQVWLGLAVLVWTILFLLVNWVLTKYKLKFDLQRNEAETKATGILADTITNQNNVKLFNGYHREIDRYGAANEVVRKIRLHTWSLDNVFDGIQGLLVLILELGLFYGAIKLWQQGRVTVGDFVLLQSYAIIIFDKVWNFGKTIRRVYSDLADADEMTALLLTPHEIQDTKTAKNLRVTAGAIEFEKVDFYYHETRKIFSKFNLSIIPQEKIALVGPSGAGKSTVVKLLLRMHELSAGKIVIDGQRINQVTQESLWSAISLVPQDPVLFHRTLLENIRYGKPTATDQEVIAAAKLAHCHEFISGFPDQYATFVGERGVKLSGGERQRVAIARAILRNAPILVLDEATSSLDSESESLIQDALNVLMKNKTVIVIAHRLSTIMKMDRIVVVDHGQITESGTHQQLLDRADGLYRQLWKLQAGGFIE